MKQRFIIILLVVIAFGTIFYALMKENGRLQNENSLLRSNLISTQKSLAHFEDFDKFMSLLIYNNTSEALTTLNSYGKKHGRKNSNIEKSMLNGYQLFWFKEGGSIPTFTTETVEARKTIYSSVDDKLFFKAFNNSVAYDSVTSRTMVPYRLFQTLNEILPEEADSAKYYEALLAAGLGYMKDERYLTGVQNVFKKSASLPPVIFTEIPLWAKILCLNLSEEWPRVIEEMNQHGNLNKLSQDYAFLYWVLVRAYENTGQIEEAYKLRQRLEAEKIDKPEDFQLWNTRNQRDERFWSAAMSPGFFIMPAKKSDNGSSG